MTPKEKAVELVNKMYIFNIYHAKQSALLTVDEIIKQYKYNNFANRKTFIEYWKEVKQEMPKI